MTGKHGAYELNDDLDRVDFERVHAWLATSYWTPGIARERVVMPSEIQALPALTGYLAFAGELPIARVTLTPREYPIRHPAIVQ